MEAKLYDLILFERLKKLRKEIADWEDQKNVTFIFSDKQLANMALNFPTAKADFLCAVNDPKYDPQKFERYNKWFIDTIQDYLDDPPVFDDSYPNFLSKEEVTINGFLKPINEELQRRELPTILPEYVTKMLQHYGFLELEPFISNKRRFPTDKGKKIGIKKDQNGRVTYQFSVQSILLGLLYEMRLLPQLLNLNDPPPKLGKPLRHFAFKKENRTMMAFLAPINEELNKRYLPEIDTEGTEYLIKQCGYLDYHMVKNEYFPTALGKRLGMSKNEEAGKHTVYTPVAQLFVLGMLYEAEQLP